MYIRRRTNLILLLGVFATFIGSTAVCGPAPMRAIPEDNLAYPVLLTFKNGATGSGFFLHAENKVFLVTAKHVLFDPANSRLRDTTLTLLSYPKELADAGKNRLTLDLTTLNNMGNIKSHPSEDVAVVKLGVYVEGAPPKSDAGVDTTPPKVPAPTTLSVAELWMSFLPGVIIEESTSSDLLTVSRNTVDTLDQVLVGNEVVMFGYPTSLSLLPNPKIDFQRPLLRRGIVAGENPPQHSIILDCPSYQGDSGGPILEIYTSAPALETHFRIIGVMSSFVPFADNWVNQHFGYTNTTLQNSGYSIATPMDFVLELIK